MFYISYFFWIIYLFFYLVISVMNLINYLIFIISKSTMILLFQKKKLLQYCYILIYLFIYYVSLKFNISYLFYENYNIKNTFRLGLKYGCMLCEFISLTNGLKICNKSHFLDLDLSYTIYIFLCYTIYWLFFFSSNSMIFQVLNNHSN